MEWFYIIAGWIFLNVLVKLFVNSIERIFKDKIDKSIKKAPVVISGLFIEIVRLFLIVFYLPLFIVKLIPLSISNSIIKEIRYTIDIILSKRRFHNIFPYYVLLLAHPLALFSYKRQDELRELWFQKLNKKTISNRNRNKRRLTRRSS